MAEKAHHDIEKDIEAHPLLTALGVILLGFIVVAVMYLHALTLEIP